MDTTSLIKTDDPSIIVHAWRNTGSRANPPADIIPETVAAKKSREVTILPIRTGLGKRKKAWKAAEVMFAGHWASLSVVGDLRPADFKRVVVYALEFEDMLNRTIGAEPQGIPYRIKIFADHKEFLQVAARAGAPNAASYYAPNTHDIVSYFDPTVLSSLGAGPVMTHGDLQVLIAHEFTHAFMDIVWGRHSSSSPIWFLEGMAEYFQHFTWENGRTVAGAVSKRQLRILANNDALPISEFVQVKRDRMYGPDFPWLYAQAWVITHFLQTYHQDKIRGLLAGDDIDVRGLEGPWRKHFEEMAASVGGLR